MNYYKLLHYTLNLNQCAMQSHFFYYNTFRKGVLHLSEETTKGLYKNQTLLTLD